MNMRSISNFRIEVLPVGSGNTAHSGLSRLVSSPTGENLKYS